MDQTFDIFHVGQIKEKKKKTQGLTKAQTNYRVAESETFYDRRSNNAVKKTFSRITDDSVYVSSKKNDGKPYHRI